MKKLLWLIVILLSLRWVLTGVWWISVALTGAVIVFLWLRTFLRKPLSYWLRCSAVVAVLIVLAIVLRVFIVEIYGVHTPSMADTILPGDYIIVSKLEYGPRLPRSPLEIPLINAFFFLHAADQEVAVPWWGGGRLSGISRFKIGDIMIFKSPEDGLPFVKRCVALPHDTIHLRDSEIYINDRYDQDMPLVRKVYQVHYTPRFENLLDSLNVLADMDLQQQRLLAGLNGDQYRLIRNRCADLKVMLAKTDTVPRTYPWQGDFLWSMDNFGPFVVPQKGMTILLDHNNFLLYSGLINQHEELAAVLKRVGDKILLGDFEISTYTFKKDYYFMMGDNRHDSRDSRLWGPVPQDCILGKVDLVLFSHGRNGIDFGRMLKMVR